MSLPTSEPPSFLTAQTLLSLLTTVAILATAYSLSLALLPSTTTTKLRTLYIWHLADGLTHLTLEASFLYNCFFVSAALPPPSFIPNPSLSKSTLNVGLPATLYGDSSRVYGPAYGTNPSALLWQEYAKADHRWGGADLTVVSLELLTVLVAGPLALWVAELIRRGGGAVGGGKETGSLWFWASALAVGELYGGFMTFAPEWLSGNENLDGGNWMYLWLYLIFFNMLWVFFPFWVLYEAYNSITDAFAVADKVVVKGKKKA